MSVTLNINDLASQILLVVQGDSSIDIVNLGECLVDQNWSAENIQQVKELCDMRLRETYGEKFPQQIIFKLQATMNVLLASYARKIYHESSSSFDKNRLRFSELAQIGKWSWELATKKFSSDLAFREMHNRSNENPIISRKDFLSCICLEDAQEVSDSISQLLSERKPISIEYRVNLPDNQKRYLEMNAEVLCNESEEPIRILGVCRDVTDTVLMRAKLEDLTRLDPLTGALNRRGLHSSIQTEVERRRRRQSEIQAIFIDLDDFKRINDVYGHSIGDEVLQSVSRILISNIRETDHVARLGGDEFMVLLPSTDRESATRVAEKIYKSLTHSIVSNRFPHIRVGLSLGLVSASKEDEDVADFIERTERALHAAKRLGKGRIIHEDHLFQDELRGERLSADEIVKQLRSEKTYFALRQPIMNIKKDFVVGYELLTRSRCPGLRSPDDFLQFAKDINIVNLVDMHAFRVCSRAARTLRPGQVCHLNILPSSLEYHMAEEILSMLPQGKRLQSICIELSEKEFVKKPEKFSDVLAKLRQSGLKIALDDVGNGVSSLETLLLVRPEVVKIDRAMVFDISKKQVKRTSLYTLIEMVSSWGAEVVAEGVESVEDLEVLRELGIDYAQGYLFGLPEPISAK